MFFNKYSISIQANIPAKLFSQCLLSGTTAQTNLLAALLHPHDSLSGLADNHDVEKSNTHSQNMES